MRTEFAYCRGGSPENILQKEVDYEPHDVKTG